MSPEHTLVPAGRKLGLRLMVLFAVSGWAVFSLLYAGVEDGSSGLSPLGYLVLAFYMPGLLLFQALEGSHRNSDVPAMVFAGWAFYLACGQLAVSGYLWIRTARSGETRQN